MFKINLLLNNHAMSLKMLGENKNMSLVEPQYPRKLMWWEYAEAKTNFVIWLLFISSLIVAGIGIWKAST